jgi:predicted phosphodiesterase
MKIKVFSDLHLEFRDHKFDHIHTEHPDDKETILLLAGDIGLGMGARPFVEEMCRHFKEIIYCCGNHEYYHQPDFMKVNEDWQDYELNESPDNFHFLYNDWRILDGVRFLGGTMWTNFNNGDPISISSAHRMMNDYAEIKSDGRPITPHFIIREHDKFIDFLLQKFNEPFDGPTVVMSHHSPGNELKRRGRRGDRSGAAYFADIEDIIGRHDIACLHVHGHTHQSYDYMINNTRVVCNPYGYWGHATNPGFDRNLIIEV